MSDLIDRQAAMVTAIRAAIDWNRLANPQYSIAHCIGEAMRQLPSAQLERKRGHWIDMDSDLEKYDDIKCSCCKHEFTVDAYHWTDIGFIKDDLNFCPNCGADMRGENDG